MIANLYKKGKTPVHKTDPRIKLFLLVFITFSFFLTGSLKATGFFLIFLLFLISLSGIKEVWRAVKSILPLLVFVTILTPPFHTGGEVYLRLNTFILLTSKGVRETAQLLIRFTGITSAFFLFFLTTEIDDLILSLQWFKVPYSATLVITISLRYIPHILHIYSNVTDAHRLRQNSTGKKKTSPAQRIRNLFPILVSVLIQSIRTIPSLAMALESKGFGFPAERTRFRNISVNGNIPLQLASASVIVLAVITAIIL